MQRTHVCIEIWASIREDRCSREKELFLSTSHFCIFFYHFDKRLLLFFLGRRHFQRLEASPDYSDGLTRIHTLTQGFRCCGQPRPAPAPVSSAGSAEGTEEKGEMRRLSIWRPSWEVVVKVSVKDVSSPCSRNSG